MQMKILYCYSSLFMCDYILSCKIFNVRNIYVCACLSLQYIDIVMQSYIDCLLCFEIRNPDRILVRKPIVKCCMVNIQI